MKTSKLLLITFVGLLFSVLTVTVDLQNRGQLTSIKELPTAAKTCLQKYFPNKEITYEKVKNEFVRAAKDIANVNTFEQRYFGDDMLAYLDE